MHAHCAIIKESKDFVKGAGFMDGADSFWWYITLKTDADNGDALQSLADISGSIGAEVMDSPSAARLRAYYRNSEDLSFWKKALMDAGALFEPVEIEDCGKIENRPWHTAAEEAFPPLEVGEGLVVLAPWHRGKEPEDRMPLYINPGSAFGTGYHESTQIALELLEGAVKEGDSFADIGTGSGILTICAKKLGASEIHARDIDPAVIEEVKKNFALNGLDADEEDVRTGDLLKDFSHIVDVLTANILFDPLVSMLRDVPASLHEGGSAIFSGLLFKEREQFLKALEEAGMVPDKEIVKGEWWGVSAKSAP